jgi:VanZ family protein
VGFLVGLAVGSAVLLVATRYHAGIWMPVAMGVLLAGAVGYAPWIRSGAFKGWYALALVAGSAGAWLVSDVGWPPPVRRVGDTALVLASLSLVALMASMIAAAKADKDSRKGSLWLIPTLLMAWGIAYVSGAPGRVDTSSWLSDLLGLSGQAAETARFVVRKAGHFVFYGLLGMFTARSALAARVVPWKALLFGLFTVLVVGGFDELRQSAVQGRDGSLRDLSIDLAGAFAFIVFTLATRSRKKR